jgi:hypothetical protein
MTAELHHLPEAKPRLHCAECGVTVEAQCGCGVGYITAAEAAARAIKATPEKSDRAIAEEIGVGNKTVSRARKTVVSNDTTEKRKGRDGKSYAAKRPPRKHSTEVRQRVASLVLDEGKTHDEAMAGLSARSPPRRRGI